MSGRQVSFGIVLACVFTLCGPAVVRAQDLDVSPLSWDFGNVPVGSSSTVTFDLLSSGSTSLWVYVVALIESPTLGPPLPPYACPDEPVPSWSLGAFSFNPATWQTSPIVRAAGEHAFVDVIFAPPAPGDHLAYLFIQSNDAYPPPGPQVFLPLEGTGVSAVPVPGAGLLALLGVGLIGCLRRRPS
jgi:hypothetical protein